ncbi:MAG: CAP domain-containing protein [Chloroflexota bacterium]
MNLKRKSVSILLLATTLILFLGLAGAGFAVADPNPGPPPVFPESSVVPAFPAAADLEPVAYLPLVLVPPEPLPWVDTQDRAAVQHYFLTEYQASEGIAPGWTGSHSGCTPGTTSAAFREAVLRRINYFRAMAGIPPVKGFDDTYNRLAQAAALMMSVNNALNHTPPTNWLCYSQDGYDGASSSNLYLGIYGPAAISGYMYDPGSGNTFVGHRRWILYPQTQQMGTGDVPPQNGYRAANALWVFDANNIWGPRPVTREAFVAWPPPGYVPYQLVYPRWSFAYAGADFSGAWVTMTQNGQPVAVQVNPLANGYGENTLVWEPNGSFGGQSMSDVAVHVTIHNVSIDGQVHSFDYQVVVFDPAG